MEERERGKEGTRPGLARTARADKGVKGQAPNTKHQAGAPSRGAQRKWRWGQGQAARQGPGPARSTVVMHTTHSPMVPLPHPTLPTQGERLTNQGEWSQRLATKWANDVIENPGQGSLKWVNHAIHARSRCTFVPCLRCLPVPHPLTFFLPFHL